MFDKDANLIMVKRMVDLLPKPTDSYWFNYGAKIMNNVEKFLKENPEDRFYTVYVSNQGLMINCGTSDDKLYTLIVNAYKYYRVVTRWDLIDSDFKIWYPDNYTDNN